MDYMPKRSATAASILQEQSALNHHRTDPDRRSRGESIRSPVVRHTTLSTTQDSQCHIYIYIYTHVYTYICILYTYDICVYMYTMYSHTYIHTESHKLRTTPQVRCLSPDMSVSIDLCRRRSARQARTKTTGFRVRIEPLRCMLSLRMLFTTHSAMHRKLQTCSEIHCSICRVLLRITNDWRTVCSLQLKH